MNEDRKTADVASPLKRLVMWVLNVLHPVPENMRCKHDYVYNLSVIKEVERVCVKCKIRQRLAGELVPDYPRFVKIVEWESY